MLPPKDQMEQFKREQQQRFQPQEEPQQPPMFAQFGPPDFGDEEEVFDERELEQAYEGFDDDEDDDYDPELEQMYEDEPQHQHAYEQPVPPSMRQEGGAFLRDDEIFPGGPSRTEVASWKKQFENDGHTVNLTTIGDETFIWRTMSRTEYREIMALPNTDPLQREEIICEITMLFPYEYNFASMANRKAGVPAILAEQVMHESGFKKVAPPIRL